MGKKRLKTNRFSIMDFDMAHYRMTDSYTKAVDKLFAIATNEITNAASKADFDPDKPFSFDDYPKVKAQMQKTVASLTSKVQSVIETGSRKQWLFSCKKNDAFIKSIFDTSKLKKSELKQMTDKCLDALYAFQARKVAGMNLSQRVWKYTDQFREQIEHALDVGLGEGRSAQELSRDVRQNLNDPNRLFRRVRDKRGNLVLSKAAKAFHPGRGVYRSSYKNAMRLTRSEINMAYRKSDYQRWQNLDFVVGFEIMRSNHEPLCKCSTCEKLVGRYPKTIKFVGWHPQCMCFAIPIIEDYFSEGRKNDRVNRLKAALKGTEAKKYISPETIDKMPEGFNNWVDAHVEAQKNWSSTPYFIKDNFLHGSLKEGLKIKLPIVPEANVDPLAGIMPQINNARQLASKWGLTVQSSMLEQCVAAKDVPKIKSRIATIEQNALMMEKADKEIRAKCDKWGLNTYILDQAMNAHDYSLILKAHAELETRCINAENDYNTYISDARNAINDANSHKVDASEVQSDVYDAGDLRNWLMGKVNFKKRLSDLLDRIKNTLNPSGEKALNDVCDSAINNKVVYNDVKPLVNQLTTNEIIQRLGGGDLTGGSCSSLAFSFAGNRCGFDVLDFRGGASRDTFSSVFNIVKIAKGVGGIVNKHKNDFSNAHQLLSNVKEGKEYYFTCGSHAAIVRKGANGFEYLELQSRKDNGFHPLTDEALKNRFRAKKSHSTFGIKYEQEECLIDVDLFKSETFRKLLGYINTNVANQKKGSGGTIK